MKTQAIIKMMTTKVKSILQNHSEQLERPLSIENAESVIKIIGQAVTQAAAEGLKTYLEKNEIRENTVTHQGQKYHFSRSSDKSFHTPFGKIVLKRRLYQNQEGKSFVPLDQAMCLGSPNPNTSEGRCFLVFDKQTGFTLSSLMGD